MGGRMMRGALGVAAGVLAALVISGCLGGGQGNGIVVFSWPTSGSLVNTQSIRIEVIGNNSMSALMQENRPTNSGSTTIPLVGLNLGTNIFKITAYSGTNANGVILGQGYGQMQVSTSVPMPTYVGGVLDASAFTTIVRENDNAFYVGDTLSLYAVVKNPDSTVVIVPTSTFQWSSGNTSAATVGLSNGQVTAVAATSGVTIYVDGSPSSLDTSIKLVVLNHVPNVSLSASPTQTVAGGAVTLTWTSSYATSVLAATNFLAPTVNGSTAVYPTATTTYSLTVKGPGGTASSNVTVLVP
jgi:hypothetical protein